MVHSSLSALGQIDGGAVTVIDQLGEFCGTLCMPAHSYCYPDSENEPGPIFDRQSTPSQVGLISEQFRSQPGVVRSINPTHSLAARGELADEICVGHYATDTPCGKGTPYARMIDRRCAALMFGVSMHSYTFFHTAEDAAGSSFAYEEGTQDRLRVRKESGDVYEYLGRRQTRNERRFREMDIVLEKAGLLRRCRLGLGELLYLPDCHAVNEFLVERLGGRGDYLFKSCPEPLENISSI
jgi:aminoglycoside 3-N-acetyltransferase